MHIIEQQANHSRAACLVAPFASLALEFRLNSVPRFQWDIYFKLPLLLKSILSRVNHKTVLIISGRVLLKWVRGLESKNVEVTKCPCVFISSHFL